MRVLMITNMYPSETNPVFGVFVARQVAALRESGIDVRLVENSDDRSGLRSLAKYATLLVRTVRAAREGGFDVVVGHFLYPTAWLASVAAHLAHAPYVVVAHGTDVGSAARGGLLASLSRRALLGADAVVAVSSALGKRLRAELGVASDVRVRVVHMGVDRDVFRPNGDARALLGCRDDERVVLFVGNLVPVKGPDVLLEAFASMRTALDSDVRLIFIGDGAMRASLLDRAAVLGIADAVSFVGRLDSPGVALHMAAADVVAMPSRNEGLGLVAIEALACGTPVVASRVGGLAEILPEHCGALVEPENAQSLATGLTAVLGRGKQAYEESCVSSAVEHDVRVMAQRFTDVLEEVRDASRPE